MSSLKGPSVGVDLPARLIVFNCEVLGVLKQNVSHIYYAIWSCNYPSIFFSAKSKVFKDATDGMLAMFWKTNS